MKRTEAEARDLGIIQGGAYKRDPDQGDSGILTVTVSVPLDVLIDSVLLSAFLSGMDDGIRDNGLRICHQ